MCAPFRRNRALCNETTQAFRQSIRITRRKNPTRPGVSDRLGRATGIAAYRWGTDKERFADHRAPAIVATWQDKAVNTGEEFWNLCSGKQAVPDYSCAKPCRGKAAQLILQRTGADHG